MIQQPARDRRPIRALALALATATVLALAGCGPAPAPGDDGVQLRQGAIAFTPCALDSPSGQSVEAQCATVPVPENHDAPAGRKIDLAVAWLPSSGLPDADPVVMIAGGPGQSALESYPMLDGAFRDARRNRNVLLVDARGTGGSHPLRCTDEDGKSAFGDSADGSLEATRTFAARCRDQLSATSDLRFYTTTDHVRDLDFVRDLLGVARLNLYGVSYGTRVAQQYAARFPERVRSVVLDSVVPNTLVLGQAHARNLEQALQAQFARCRAEAACVDNLGDPSTQLPAVRDALRAGGIAAQRFRDPVTGTWREEVPAFGHLVGLLRMYSYQPNVATTLPLLLHEAAQGRYESMLGQSTMLLENVGESIMHGMQLSVTCAEDAADMRVDPDDAGTVLGNDMVAYLRAQCEVWPTGTRPAGFRTPLSGEVPVLAISGEFDPVTPSRYGDEIVASLPNGRHLVLPGQGHSVLGAGCMPKLFAQFLETADAKALDASCLERLVPMPPFAGAYGWEP